MNTKQIPRLPRERADRPSPLATLLSIPLGIAVVTSILAFFLWLATVIADRTDLVSYRECVGISFAVLMTTSMLIAVSRIQKK